MVVNNKAEGPTGGAVFGGAAAWETKTAARPLPFEVALYCVEKVRYLPALREKYRGWLDEAGLAAARTRTEESLGEANEEREREEAFSSHCGLWIYHE